LFEIFKSGKIDLLFVFNMPLTGFDAKRLKKLYIGRIVKDHNLLQTLTHVNRPYKKYRYGFVVDFADIRKEFDTTNKAYFDALQGELGDRMENYSNLFKTSEEIEAEIKEINEKLWHNHLNNAELFSQQIFDKVTDLNGKNDLLKAKYEYDAKYACLHKRIMERGNISKKESELGEALLDIKKQTDNKVLINNKILDNESYFNKMVIQMVVNSFSNNKIELDPDSARYINNCLVKEYMNEYNGTIRNY
jgi:type I restriction enzyme R subunit